MTRLLQHLRRWRKSLDQVPLTETPDHEYRWFCLNCGKSIPFSDYEAHIQAHEHELDAFRAFVNELDMTGVDESQDAKNYGEPY